MVPQRITCDIVESRTFDVRVVFQLESCVLHAGFWVLFCAFWCPKTSLQNFGCTFWVGMGACSPWMNTVLVSGSCEAASGLYSRARRRGSTSWIRCACASCCCTRHPGRTCGASRCLRAPARPGWSAPPVGRVLHGRREGRVSVNFGQ